VKRLGRVIDRKRHKKPVHKKITRGQVSSDSESESSDEGKTIMGIEYNQAERREISYTSGLKAGDNLPTKLVNKIWRHEYVDFYSLLYPNSEDEYQFAIGRRETFPTLNLTPKKRRALTEREWSTAFDDFVAIYCRKHPADLQDLLTYGKFIKTLMNTGDNWHYYDYMFRTDREHSHCNWSQIRIDLQISASRNQYGTKSLKSQSSTSNFIPKGYCFYFHAENKHCARGNDCYYKHNCMRCGRIHPSYLVCNENRFAKLQTEARPNTHANKQFTEVDTSRQPTVGMKFRQRTQPDTGFRTLTTARKVPE